MPASRHRQLTIDDARAARRRRLLLTALAVQAVSVVVALVAELRPLPDASRIAAVSVALVALVVAWRVSWLLGRDDRLRAREAEATIDLAGSMLMTLDRDARIRLANPAACAVLGREEDEVIGRELPDLAFEDEVKAAAFANFDRLMSGEEPAQGYRSERVVVRPDGERRHVAWHVSPRRGRHGELTGLLISGEDITAEHDREVLHHAEQADLAQLRRLAQDVAGSDDAREAVVHRLATMLGADLVALSEAGPGGTWTYTAATFPLAGSAAAVAARGSGGCDVVRNTRAPLVIPDASADGRVSPELAAATGVVGVRFEPVLDGERVIAVLIAGWRERVPAFDGRRSELLALAADETAIALGRVATLRRLESVALTDSLTGVPNRRAFDAELGRALARARRDGGPVTLAVLDLNAFKALNDRSGHDAGDALLAACAGAWEAELRAGDTLARLGGDEFAAILPDCDDVAAAGLAARLHRVTPHRPGVAIGCATWTGQSAHELYRVADRALYRDKAMGRGGRLADPDRVAAVERTGLFHGEHSEALDAIAAEAREALGIDGVFVNLLGAERLAHVSRPEGMQDSRPVSESYCEYVVAAGRPFVVADARLDAVLQHHPGIELGGIAYAGMPLSDGDGNVVGALCAADDQPRTWSTAELWALDRFARKASRELARADQPAAQPPA